MLKIPRPRTLGLVGLLTMAGAFIQWFALTTPPTSSGFPKAIADQLEKRGDVYFPDFDLPLRYFCFVGGYENVAGFMRERGIQSDIDIWVNEGDTVLVLVGPNDEVSYRTLSSSALDSQFDVYGCYPAIHNRLVFKLRDAHSIPPRTLTVERVAGGA